MSVLDQTRNQRGVQTLGTEFHNDVAGGHGYMIPHTNGSTYCVFARNFLDGVQQRRLFISYTTDGGLTWATPVQLTSGNWDDDPCGLQLDTGSTSSDIGIVFTRSSDATSTSTRTVYRIGVEVSGLTVNTPVDPLTGSPNGYKFPSLVKTSSGFAIYAISNALSSNAAVTVWTNTSFTTNNWVLASISNFWGGSTLNIYSLSVKRLANGDFAAISVVRTAFNGTVGGIPPRGIVRLDVYVTFSDDEGTTWSTPQNLTNYSGTPSLDLSGLTVAFDADLAQLTDGTVVVLYSEALTPQAISDTTTLALPSNAGNVICAVYHPVHNYLILGTDDPTNGGIWVYDLTGQTRTRLHTGSTPALWGNVIQDVSISSDGKYLAIGHSTGLEIVDTTSATISSWTITPIRTSTTPASLNADMQIVHFDTSGYLLYVAYGASSSSNVWGFVIDASSPTVLTNLNLTIGSNLTVINFFVQASDLLVVSSNYVGRTNKTTGASLYATNFSGASINAAAADDLNNEVVAVGIMASVTGLHRLTDSGSAFAIAQSFSPTTTPACPSSIDSRTLKTIPGVGCYFSSGATGAGSEGFYAFGPREPIGYITHHGGGQAMGENQFPPDLNGMSLIKSGDWRFSSDDSRSIYLSMTHLGRLRYGFFPYHTGTQQLTTAGVDFYDVVNINRVDAYRKLQKPRFAADSNDNLVIYVRKYDTADPNTPFAAMNGHVEPDAYKLMMRARILASSTRELQMRARIRVNQATSLDMQARIVFAQCLKMKARIVPINTVGISMRARIFGFQSTSVENQFLVESDQETTVRMTFIASTGNVRAQSMTMRARIVRSYTTEVTNHLIVTNQQVNPGVFSFSAEVTRLQNMTMQARITRP